ncbi:ATP-grasp domain-containing protein [Neobacillus terrae]|uniref:ATP-grasp domain-containing protein n=1 Tax=Neobacillus terrae TaxID=3034837 RepID=UPI00140AB5A7|nr:ATP-grasp domain-containing protein [Neobacillus terrae]NHM31115.1 ATP-grasp domain-containing protein [Neobacillus terrae]
MSELITVLITGIGSPGAPGVIKSLRAVKEVNFRIIGVDIKENIAAKAMVDRFFTVPKASDPEFINQIHTLCFNEKIEVILPMVSQELLALSNHAEKFKKSGVAVSVSNFNSLDKTINKGKLFNSLSMKGISTPKFSIVHTSEELSREIFALGYPEKPVCIKPVISDGSRGFRILDKNKNRIDLLYYEKPSSVYISFNELMETLKGTSSIPDTMVMEYLPFEEYSVDILANHGEVIVAVPRLRDEINNGISVKSTIVKEEDVIQYSSQIVKELGLHGNIGVQVRRDSNHIPKIIEINPRIQGTIVHCTAAGINLPFLAIKLAKNHPITQEELKINWGLQMYRFWEEVYFDKGGIQVNWEE